MRTLSPVASLVLAVACSLLFTGCDDDQPEVGAQVATQTPDLAPDPNSESPVPVGPTETTTEPTAADATTEPPEPEPTTAAPPEATGAACLTGTWKLRNETFEAAIMAMIMESEETPPEVRDSLSISLSGDSHIRFDGRDLYTAWQDAFTMTMTFRGQAGVKHVIDSGDAGNYGATDAHVWVHDMQEIYMSAEMTIEGVGTVAQDSSSPGMASIHVFGFSGEVPGMDREVVDGAAAFTCGAQDLVLHADGGLSAAFARVSSE